LSGSCIFYGLLLEQDGIEAIKSLSRRFMLTGILIILLCAPAFTSLVSSQGFSPLPAAVAAIEKS